MNGVGKNGGIYEKNKTHQVQIYKFSKTEKKWYLLSFATTLLLKSILVFKSADVKIFFFKTTKPICKSNVTIKTYKNQFSNAIADPWIWLQMSQQYNPLISIQLGTFRIGFPRRPRVVQIESMRRLGLNHQIGFWAKSVNHDTPGLTT